jgi:serine/threonine protein kinase
MTTLSKLLPANPPPGFRLLVRYVDRLALLHEVSVMNFTFKLDGGDELDMQHTEVLACTRKSLVLQRTPQCYSVVKVGPTELVQKEATIHALVDGGPNIRKLVATGVVDGVEAKESGPLLRFVELEGLGEPLQSKHIGDLDTLFCQASAALEHMHSEGVFHRDIKPSNMIIINGSLMLNDFDCSCLRTEREACKRLQVGTTMFRSPFLTREYTEWDDWASLVMSFLSLRIDISNKADALQRALGLDWVPDKMKKRTDELLSNH